MQFENNEFEIYAIIKNTSNDAKQILKQVKEETATLSERNKQIASEYVLNIREVLRHSTIQNIKEVSQLISKKTNDLDKELLIFEGDIASMIDGNGFVTQNDIVKLIDDLTDVNASNVIEVLNKILEKVEMKIQEFCTDMKKLYTYYSGYVSNIIDNKVYNITDGIRMKLLQAKRQSCTEVKHIKFCYIISAQNEEIFKQLQLTMQVINIVRNSSETVKLLLADLTQNNEAYPPHLVTKSQCMINQVLNESESLLDMLLKNEEYYLGSMVRSASFKDYKLMKNFVITNYRVTIQELATFINQITAEFQIVYDKHWTRITDSLFPALQSAENKIKNYAPLINDTTIRNEYIKKAEFESLKLWTHDQFLNVTSVVNSVFENKKQLRAEALKIEITNIINEKVPLVSSLSINAYLPSDVCPVSMNYQQFISTLLEPQPESSEVTDLRQAQKNIDTLTVAWLPVDNLQMEINKIGHDDGSTEVSNSFTDFLKTILKTFFDAGYTVDYEYIGSEDKQEIKN